MTYNDYRTYILTCEYLNREPTGQYKKVHDFLTGLWDGMEFHVKSQTNQIVLQKGVDKKLHDFLTGLWVDKKLHVKSQTNQIVLQKGVEWFIVQDLKNGDMWCQYEQAWSFFKTDMDMELTGTQDFIKSAVDEHLKCKVEIPRGLSRASFLAVEEQHYVKVGTPSTKKDGR